MDAPKLDCPSAQPDMVGARPIGVVSGSVTEVRVAFFKKDALEAFDWRPRFSGPQATRVLRFSAQCETAHCGHFDGETCQLGRRVSEELEPVVDSLPACLIRSTCRWHAERGSAACLRCPQVTTMVEDGTHLAEVAVTQASC